MTKYRIHEFDIVYLSYDEPNAEKNWGDLLNKAPWAKRVHGVKGFDSAHRECAKISTTDRIFTIDGDSIVKPYFFDETVEIEEGQENYIFSWSAMNIVNGLAYGNGGVKLWPREIIANLKSHELADDTSNAVDFCWDFNYFQMNDIVAVTHPNSSPYQAFRAGFREGVKMSLDRGKRVTPEEFRFKVVSANMARLQIWMSVGADVENGLWCIYGSRLGCKMINLTDWDHALIRDYDWLLEFWDTQKDKEDELQDLSIKLGEELREGLKIYIADWDSKESAFFKDVWTNPERKGIMFRENE